MFEVVVFKKEHVKPLLAQGINQGMDAIFDDEMLQILESRNLYLTLLQDGEVMCCGGISPYWAGRGEMWCLFSEHCKSNFVPVFRMIRKWLKHELEHNYIRIELSIGCGLQHAKRRAQMLGFTLETERARKYLYGEDCSIYTMVRE